MSALALSSSASAASVCFFDCSACLCAAVGVICWGPQEYLWRAVAPSADAQCVSIFDVAGATAAGLAGLDVVRAVMAVCQTHYVERSCVCGTLRGGGAVGMQGSGCRPRMRLSQSYAPGAPPPP